MTRIGTNKRRSGPERRTRWRNRNSSALTRENWRMRTLPRRTGIRLAGLLIALSLTYVWSVSVSRADPSDPDYSQEPTTPSAVVIRPLPVVTPRPMNWEPKFPFPYDRTRSSVTEADITAEREMCQWFTLQYYDLVRQIDSLQFNRITPNGPGVLIGSGTDWDYSVRGLQQQADIVTANIDQSEDFLAPRVQALTRTEDHSGDFDFAIFQGKSFYLLWQHLSNVGAGIKSHQPDWFSGPSLERVKRFGTTINRSHVCG